MDKARRKGNGNQPSTTETDALLYIYVVTAIYKLYIFVFLPQLSGGCCTFIYLYEQNKTKIAEPRVGT